MTLLQYKKTTLDNGLEVYAIPCNKDSQVASINIFYKVGSRNETMGKSGIAHMLEHLNFKSTKNRKAGEFDAIVKGFGGINNASTGFDYTQYFITCNKANLTTALELYSDIMQNLNLLEEEFLPEREVVLEERRWRTDNDPIGYLFFRLYNTAFIHHPYHWSPIGFKADIKNWSIDDIKEFHAKFYQPKNAFVVVSGDIDEDEVFALVKKHFEKIKNTKEIPTVFIKEPPQDGEKEAVVYRKSDVEFFAIAYKTPPFSSADQPLLDALSYHLGNGKSSLLYRELVDKKGLLSSVDVINLSAIDDNLFIIIGSCNEGIEAKKAIKEIEKCIAKLKAKELKDDDITKIKNNLKLELIHSLSSASKVANLYGRYIAMGNLDNLSSSIEELEKLDSKKALLVAQKYLTDKNKTTIILKKES